MLLLQHREFASTTTDAKPIKHHRVHQASTGGCSRLNRRPVDWLLLNSNNQPAKACQAANSTTAKPSGQAKPTTQPNYVKLQYSENRR